MSDSALFLTIAHVSVALYMSLAGAMFALGTIFNDKMLRRFALAFALLAVSRFLRVTLPLGETNAWLVGLVVGVRALAAWFIIVGALNGDVRYKLTKWALAAALASTTFSAAIGTGDPARPLAFALFLGYTFAAVRFNVGRRGGRFRECPSYDFFYTVFGIKALLAVAQIVFISVAGQTVIFAADAVTALAMVSAAVFLAVERHRVVVDCTVEY